MKKGVCHVCSSAKHWASSYPDRYEKGGSENDGKTANVVTDTEMKDSGYIPKILSLCQSPNWLIDTGANVHACADASMFSSYQVIGTSPVLMGNRSYATVRGV